jgi:hypothetical protein
VIDVEAAAVISKFAKEIEKRALPLNLWPDVPVKEHRARNHAWRLAKYLQTFLEHATESDTYLKLYEMAKEKGDEKEMERCWAIAKSEDRGYNRAQHELEKLLKEIQAEEKKDPNALKYGKELEAARKARAESRARHAEEKRERRNAQAKARREAAKVEALAAVQAASKKSKRSTAKA